MDSMAYWEQVGVKRQLAGVSGEIKIWYNLMKIRKICLNSVLISVHLTALPTAEELD
jgi:hypothetical protein